MHVFDDAEPAAAFLHGCAAEPDVRNDTGPVAPNEVAGPF